MVASDPQMEDSHQSMWPYCGHFQLHEQFLSVGSDLLAVVDLGRLTYLRSIHIDILGVYSLKSFFVRHGVAATNIVVNF